MATALDSRSLLTFPEEHPLLPAEAALKLGSTVVVAPHPDDESLGCGGLLALLANAGLRPRVLVITDGSRSHPNSQSHPAARMAAVREQETLDAARALGVPARDVQFLRFRDCGLPANATLAFAEAATRIRDLLTTLAPATLVVPWRRDPHCDHEATWHLLREAVAGWDHRPRWLEYPVWAWTRADQTIAPQSHEARAWRLDISSVLTRKEQAIAQHRSQLGALIHDDPEGFKLLPAMLAHFARPWELFLEPTNG